MERSILFFQPTLNRNGGVERITTTIAAHFKDKYDFSFLTTYPVEDTFDGGYRTYSLNEKVDDSAIGKALKAVTRARSLQNFMRMHNPSYVVVSADGCIISAMLAKLFSSRPIVIIAFMHQDVAKSSSIHRVLLSLLLPHADAVVAVSEGIKETLTRIVPKGRLVRIYNVTDVQQNQSAASLPLELAEDDSYFSNAGATFVSIGRLVYQKAQWRLIEAMPAVIAEYPDTKLLIIGEGPLRPLLEARIRSLSLQESVFLIGIRKNIFPYVARALAIVLPSFFESFGMVLIESLSVGRPVIASDCEYGPREILDTYAETDPSYPLNTPYGMLTAVPSADVEQGAPEPSLVAALKALINKKDPYIREACIERARDFDVAKGMEEWQHLFDRVGNT